MGGGGYRENHKLRFRDGLFMRHARKLPRGEHLRRAPCGFPGFLYIPGADENGMTRLRQAQAQSKAHAARTADHRNFHNLSPALVMYRV